ncbi:MAG: SufD family Fe-S cluster assembly protein, partial [Bacteroidales bacterium]|nr:SufD family Fe-S cluster assembly protein [Bacteroidales bacterium]
MDKKTETIQRFSKLYSDNKSRIENNSAGMINSFRRDAMNQFIELGLPDRKNESYRYTNLDPWFNADYKSYFVAVEEDFRAAENFKCEVADLDSYDLVLLNGIPPRHNGSLAALPEGIWVGSLAEAAEKYPDLVARHYARYALNGKDGLIPLNTALASDGIFLHIEKGVSLTKPVQIINLVHSDQDMFVQHRNLIVVEDNAKLPIIVCDHALSPQKFLTNAVTEVYVGENAHFDILRVQNEHNNAAKLTHTFIHQEKNSYAVSNNITLHGGLIRNSTYHRLNGEGASSDALGLYLADRWQHVDNFVSIDHASPNCTSNQLFKG